MIEKPIRQGDLLINETIACSTAPTEGIKLRRGLLEEWQERVYNHQSKIYEGLANIPLQGSLFIDSESTQFNSFDPLKLTPLPLNFWRWPKSPHNGPAIYLVMDRPTSIDKPLLLYVGETIAADQRWKGEHDCKSYLASYSEALSKVGLKSLLSIRFWTDVPSDTKIRRRLEQELIQTWLPPFNKETRSRWKTPFTTQLK